MSDPRLPRKVSLPAYFAVTDQPLSSRRRVLSFAIPFSSGRTRFDTSSPRWKTFTRTSPRGVRPCVEATVTYARPREPMAVSLPTTVVVVVSFTTVTFLISPRWSAGIVHAMAALGIGEVG